MNEDDYPGLSSIKKLSEIQNNLSNLKIDITLPTENLQHPASRINQTLQEMSRLQQQQTNSFTEAVQLSKEQLETLKTGTATGKSMSASLDKISMEEHEQTKIDKDYLEEFKESSAQSTRLSKISVVIAALALLVAVASFIHTF